MSSPGFLLANDSNHDLLRSLLESMNAIIEHQYISKYHPPQSPYALCIFPVAQGATSITKLFQAQLTEGLGLSRSLDGSD